MIAQTGHPAPVDGAKAAPSLTLTRGDPEGPRLLQAALGPCRRFFPLPELCLQAEGAKTAQLCRLSHPRE